MNPRVTCGSSFVDCFWFVYGLVFVDYFWIKRGRVLSRIQASLMEGVSLLISESAPTPFLLLFSKSKGAASASESTCHLWKLFRWWFLSLQRLSFRWLFVSHRGFERWWIHASPLEVVSLTFSESTGAVGAKESTRHFWNRFRWWFRSQHGLSFHWLFVSNQGLGALTNPRVTFESCFLVIFWVRRGCELFRIHASPLKVFRWRFPSRHRLRFCWLFLS